VSLVATQTPAFRRRVLWAAADLRFVYLIELQQQPLSEPPGESSGGYFSFDPRERPGGIRAREFYLNKGAVKRI
jgi:hypothetical protein